MTFFALLLLLWQSLFFQALPFPGPGGTGTSAPIALLTHTSKCGTINGVTSNAIDTTGATLLIVVEGFYGLGTTPTISDSKSNSWTGLSVGNGSNNNSEIWYSIPTSVGSGHTFTVSGTGAYPSVDAASFSGTKSSSVFDVQSASGNNITGSITPTRDNSVLIAGGATSADYTSVDSGFTLLDHIANSGGNCVGSALAYLVETTATAKNVTFLHSVGAAESAVIASFFPP